METVLEYTLPHHPVLDFLRVVGCFLGAGMIGYTIRDARLWQLDHRLHKATVALLFTFAAVGVLLILQEIEQWGDEIVWWRFPLLLFIAVNGLIAVRGFPQDEPGSRPPPP